MIGLLIAYIIIGVVYAMADAGGPNEIRDDFMRLGLHRQKGRLAIGYVTVFAIWPALVIYDIFKRYL